MGRHFAQWIYIDGWRFLAIFALGSFLLSLISCSLGWIGVVLTVWCGYFFRNPPRVVPTREGLLTSPADGKVTLIQEVTVPKNFDIGEHTCYRVSIFLNVFDVHLNRVPYDGRVEKVVYHPGQFLNASLDKASDLNERNTVVMTTDHGPLAFTQIAGLIARRIRCDLKQGDDVKKGHIYGMIRFGSRVDIYLPHGVHPLVIEGQRVVGGETVIADFHSKEHQRNGLCI